MMERQPRTAEIHIRVAPKDKAKLERWAQQLRYPSLTEFLLAAAALHKEHGR